MKKPPYVPELTRKARIVYNATFARMHQLLRDPSSIRPVAVGDDVRQALGLRQRKRPLPRLKSNVYQTLKEIVHIFLADWRKAARAINLSIRTNRLALAKRCGNRDPGTAALHILTLIEHGFLRAKVRLGHGLQLLLNPAILVFDGIAPVPLDLSPAPVVVATQSPKAPTPAAPTAAGGAPAPSLLSHLAQMAENLSLKFSQGLNRRSK